MKTPLQVTSLGPVTAQVLLRLAEAYDLGPERCAWLIQVVTDWMGDAGHLARLECRYLKFNYLGDVIRDHFDVRESAL